MKLIYLEINQATRTWKIYFLTLRISCFIYMMQNLIRTWEEISLFLFLIFGFLFPQNQSVGSYFVRSLFAWFLFVNWCIFQSIASQSSLDSFFNPWIILLKEKSKGRRADMRIIEKIFTGKRLASFARRGSYLFSPSAKMSGTQFAFILTPFLSSNSDNRYLLVATMLKEMVIWYILSSLDKSALKYRIMPPPIVNFWIVFNPPYLFLPPIY